MCDLHLHSGANRSGVIAVLLLEEAGEVRPTTSRTGKKWRYGTAAVAVLTLGVASACSSSSSNAPAATGSSSAAGSASSAPASGGTLSFPRNETLYTSGSAYGPPVNWNPLDTGAYATGTQGLI